MEPVPPVVSPSEPKPQHGRKRFVTALATVVVVIASVVGFDLEPEQVETITDAVVTIGVSLLASLGISDHGLKLK